jgi:hypothetical protein
MIYLSSLAKSSCRNFSHETRRACSTEDSKKLLEWAEDTSGLNKNVPRVSAPKEVVRVEGGDDRRV